jgi:hypothetical protein
MQVLSTPTHVGAPCKQKLGETNQNEKVFTAPVGQQPATGNRNRSSKLDADRSCSRVALSEGNSAPSS